MRCGSRSGRTAQPYRTFAGRVRGRPDDGHVDGVGQLGAVVALEFDPLPAAGAGPVAGCWTHRFARQALAAAGDGLLEDAIERRGGEPRPPRQAQLAGDRVVDDRLRPRRSPRPGRAQPVSALTSTLPTAESYDGVEADAGRPG